MGIRKIILAIVSVFLLFSCEKEKTEGGNVPAPKDGQVSIIFKTGKPGTKATEEEIAAALADGSMFSDLWLWLVRKEGASEDIRRFVHFTFDASTEQVVEFDAVERGDYIFYAVANFTNDRGIFNNYAPDGYKVNDITYLKDDIPAAAKRQLDDNFKKLTLAPLENGVPPTVTYNKGKMPISLVKEFSVGAGVNRVAAELTRVCGRISVIIRNLSPEYSIAIHDLELSRLNPNTGYLFSRDHNVPGGEDFFHDFIPFIKTEGKDYALIGPGTESTVFSQMLYETGENVSLGLKLAGAMLVDDAMNKIPEDNYTFSQQAITKQVYHLLDAEAPSNDKQYILSPLSNTGSMLYGDGSSLSLKPISGHWYDESEKLLNSDDKYLWTYNDGTPTLKNVGNSMNIAISNRGALSFGTNTSNTSLTVNLRNPGYNIYRGSYYLSANNNSIGTVSQWYSGNNYCIWQFYPAEREEVITGYKYDTNGRMISYSTDAVQIIGGTGTAVPLTNICRNQDLRIVLNISFNPYIGEFEYVILPWNERNVDEIVFN
ncbi:MAG: hypothetical protein ACI3ZQ_02995 [Candidatus Cryptobacteroides sp.]